MKATVNKNILIVGSSEEGEVHISYNYGNGVSGLLIFNKNSDVSDAKNDTERKVIDEVKNFLKGRRT